MNDPDRGPPLYAHGNVENIDFDLPEVPRDRNIGRNIGQAYFIETKINSEIIILPNLLIWKLFLCPSFGFLVKKALSH